MRDCKYRIALDEGDCQERSLLGADGPVRRGAIDSALEPDLLLVSRCWRGGWRPVASASPGGSCQAALLGYVVIKHPASITTAGQAIDGVDRLPNHSRRWHKRIRWVSEIAAVGCASIS